MERIAFFIPSLVGGGAERVAINLLKGMAARGITLDLLLSEATGPYMELVPPQVRIIDFKVGRVMKAVPQLSAYLKKYRPRALLSHMNHTNVAALIAKELSGTKTRLFMVEQNTPSLEKSELFRGKFVLPLMKLLYPRAEGVIAVSKGVAEDLEYHISLNRNKIHVIYSPIVDDELFAKAQEPIDHPWFQPNSPPVFLAVGRLTEQKDFSTLIQAFALVRRQRPARLMILGEGSDRGKLQLLIDKLEITEDVSIPGFVKNPFAYMSKASAFVLSSRWEGLPTVLIEAMACGCPVVSTNCPSGPHEILAAGLYGSLVSVGDIVALSQAMLQLLVAPLSREKLVQRAMDFSCGQAVNRYLNLIE
jgi:glycosyltransferase involved in cell wall biosynthesis